MNALSFYDHHKSRSSRMVDSTAKKLIAMSLTTRPHNNPIFIVILTGVFECLVLSLISVVLHAQPVVDLRLEFCPLLMLPVLIPFLAADPHFVVFCFRFSEAKLSTTSVNLHILEDGRFYFFMVPRVRLRVRKCFDLEVFFTESRTNLSWGPIRK